VAKDRIPNVFSDVWGSHNWNCGSWLLK